MLRRQVEVDRFARIGRDDPEVFPRLCLDPRDRELA
jgi:hypothetical protein